MPAMFTSTRSFIKRHRTNLAVGFGIVGAGYLAVQYIGNKLSEARSQLMSDRQAKENINRRFQTNQSDCTYTVLALLPSVTSNILTRYPVETSLAELHQRKAARIARSSATASTAGGTTSSPALVDNDDTASLASFSSETFNAAPRKSKPQLWDEIKFYSLIRSFTLLYTLSLLTLLTRVQLNLLGRKNYLSSVLKSAERADDPTIFLEGEGEGGEGVDVETNRQYLSFCWWLLHRGWSPLADKVEAATKQVFSSVNPRDTLSLGHFRSLVMEVRKIVECPPVSAAEAEQGNLGGEINWLEFLLPPREQEGMVLRESLGEEAPKEVSKELRRLMDETSDLLESPNAKTVLGHMLAVGFEMLVEAKVAGVAFKGKPSAADALKATVAGNATAAAAAATASPVIGPPPRQVENVRRASMASTSSGMGGMGPLFGGITSGEDSDAGYSPRITEVVPDENTAQFAIVLAALQRQAQAIGVGVGNEFLSAIEKGTELEGFSAQVYSSNFEFVTGTV